MKDILRKDYLVLRKLIHSSKKDLLIFDFITHLDEFINCSDVLIYYSINDEVDTLGLIRFCLLNSKRVFIPRCNESMDFYLINGFDDLKLGKYNIMESTSFINDYHNSICITPGICFDKYFYRIGYGKGYYDKFFSNYDGIKIGLCYENCLIDDCFHNELDIPVDIVVTDEKVYRKRS